MSGATEMPLLMDAFGTSTRDEWMAAAAKVLKGGDFERRLVSRTLDGIRIEPLYTRRADASIVAVNVGSRPWGVTARVDHPEPPDAAALALADLEGGADALTLVFAGSQSARGFGMQAANVRDLDSCLDGVMLDLVRLRNEPSAQALTNAALIAALADRRRHHPSTLTIDFGIDPLLLSHGKDGAAWTEIALELTRTIAKLRADGFRGPFISCDLRHFHEAGASEAQELAIGLAAGVAYVRGLEANGLETAAAFAALSWTIAIDADQFLGLAKLRALRQLWAKVQLACGVEPAPILLHAETAWRMMTRRDPAVNMLRSTLATFAAAVGGADTITVLPHTQALGLPDALARRIARNTQLVLQEESNLWRVADPAAGSGAVEGLTGALCETAWSLFQEIEREGGLVESLMQGHVQARTAKVRATRDQTIATRKYPVTGTSEFPDLSETPQNVIGLRPAELPAAAIGGLTPMRLAEPFEALRDAADASTSLASGKRPCVFLANLGPLAEHGARAAWIVNLLAAGGIATLPSDGFTASGDAAAAFASSGAAIACICGTDATYDELAESTAMALKSAGATHVMIAGKPGPDAQSLLAAGVDQFVFAGQDVLAELRRLHEKLRLAAA